MTLLAKRRAKWNKASKKWRKNHPDYYAKYLKEYRKRWRDAKRKLGLCERCGNRKVIKGLTRCYKCRDYNRSQTSPTIRDIRKEDRPRAIKAQKTKGKKCCLCGSDKHNGRNWHIDHCHKTKKFRGILCNNCNIGLGQFKDSIMRLRKAISYLRKNS
jgi:hypothetical protein